MGFHVSKLRSVPVGAFEYYVYFIDAAPNAAHSKRIAESLLRLAIDSGADAAIVNGPPSLSAELSQFLRKHAPDDFFRLEGLFTQVSCLLVSEGALQITKKQLFVIPLARAIKMSIVRRNYWIRSSHL